MSFSFFNYLREKPTEVSLVTYFQSFNLQELSNILNNELSYPVTFLAKKIGEKNLLVALKKVELTEVESKAIHFDCLTKLALGVDISHVIVTGILGLTSSVLGFFAISGVGMASIIAAVFLAGIFPGLIYSLYVNLKMLRQAEKEDELKFNKIKLEETIIKVLSQKIKNEVKDSHVKLINSLKEINLDTFTQMQKNFDPIDFYLTPEGITNILTLISKANLPDNEQLKSIIENLKKIKLLLQHSHHLPYDKEPITKDFEKNISKSSPEKLNIKEYPFWEWIKHNGKKVATIALSSIARLAGNMVFPGIIILLGKTNLELMAKLRLMEIFTFLDTPAGGIAALSIATIVAAIICILTLYKQYKIDNKEHKLSKAIIVNIQNRALISNELNKYVNLLKVKELVMAPAYIQLAKQADIFTKKVAEKAHKTYMFPTSLPHYSRE